jgi:hypothetical protein
MVFAVGVRTERGRKHRDLLLAGRDCSLSTSEVFPLLILPYPSFFPLKKGCVTYGCNLIYEVGVT